MIIAYRKHKVVISYNNKNNATVRCSCGYTAITPKHYGERHARAHIISIYPHWRLP